MAICKIAFLGTLKTIEVETSLPLHVSWGDRVSRQQDGPVVYGSLVGAPYGTPEDLEVSAGQRGDWWVRHEVSVCGHVGYYDAMLTEQQRADALATYEAVAAAWRAAVASDSEIADVVEDYRIILDEIISRHKASDRQWAIDTAIIARVFRRARVVVGEQTVPGKCCVRSTRGKLLGYVTVWDGRWQGTVERV